VSEGPNRGRRRLVGGLLGVAGAAVAAGYAAQHRRVSKTRHGAPDAEAEGLIVPDDAVHHVVEVDDGGRIHVVERGRGPALVLLHGFMLSGAVWAHQLRDLADGHRVIAIELRGHGQSVPGTAGFGVASEAAGDVTVRAGARMGAAQEGSPAIRRMAMDLEQVLAALDVDRAVLVGHSMGGMVALQLLHDLPPVDVQRRIAGLVLVSTTAGPFSRLPGFTGVVRVAGPASARAVGLADRFGARLAPSEDLRWWLTRMGFGADAPAAQVQFVEGLHMATPASTLSALLPSLALFDLSRWIGAIDVPVLILVGSRDHLTPPRHAWRTASALPRAEVVELPRCGHMPMLERRREFGRLLDEFAAKIA
jgi:pimeloyl-ACP methyl ester carboxylesterase